jgi:hypothetical protein
MLHIPAIFSGTIKAIAVRDSDGLYNCCAVAMASAIEWGEIRGDLGQVDSAIGVSKVAWSLKARH